MTQIIGICGRKVSGKTTASNYIHGYLMKKNLIVENFEITESGQLKVTALFRNDKGDPIKDMGILDLQQRTPEFEQFASWRIWPIVKGYNFADTLKEVCMAVLGLTYEQCYGTDEDKNSLTEFRWEDMPGVITPVQMRTIGMGYIEDTSEIPSILQSQIKEPGMMTAREVLQYVGTDIFRKMYKNVWIDSVFNQIESEQPGLAIIADCRFKNEVEAIKEQGGLVVRLLRNNESTDSHSSENDLDNFDGFDCVIDNRNLSIQDSNLQLLKFLVDKNLV